MSIKKFHQRSAAIQHWMECYNVTGEPDDDDPRNTNNPEFEGTRAVEGLGIYTDKFLNPLKINKVNIDSLDNPKFSNIGDY